MITRSGSVITDVIRFWETVKFRLISLFFLIAVFSAGFAIFINTRPELPINFEHRMDERTNGQVFLYSYDLNRQFETKLSGSENSPWLHSSANPPISAARAIRTAIVEREKLVQDSKNLEWHFKSASLVPYNGKAGDWYWLVTFNSQSVGAALSSGYDFELRVVVLMDGTVVQPKINDEY